MSWGTSQFNEDEIIANLLAEHGEGNRLCVDIGAKHFDNSNVSNLIFERNWSAVLIDRGSKGIASLFRDCHEAGIDAFLFCHLSADYDEACSSCRDRIKRFGLRASPKSRISLIHCIVTPENVNALLPESFDLLSIDIDGQDFYVWQAMEARPNIVVIEYNAHKSGISVVPRDDLFKWKSVKDYLGFGASLDALAALGKKKGYHVVAHNRANMFFVKDT